MKATKVFKSFDEMSQDQISGLINAAASNDSASMPMNESTHPSEARDRWREDNREFAPVQPIHRWGINE